jgi:hypothetical protein
MTNESVEKPEVGVELEGGEVEGGEVVWRVE